MSTPSINDEAESELPSTEIPTTESDMKTSSTVANGSTEGSTSGGASDSASRSESTSSVKKTSSTVSGRPDSSPTSTSDTRGEHEGAEVGKEDVEAAAEEQPPPPPKLKKRTTSAPPPPADAGEVDVAGDISMQYEKKFKDILRERRKKSEADEALRNKNKTTVDEMNAYYKAWVTADYERRKNIPKPHDAAKKRHQEAIRQKKAQEAFCTWLSYKKQQGRMERRRWRLRRTERRQLVQKRSRAASERAYECWLADKRRQHQSEKRPAGHYPPAAHTRDMSLLNAKSYRAAMGAGPPPGGLRCASASPRMQGGDEFYNVENVYCPQHKTEYRLETNRTTGGSCYRLTSVRKLD